MKITEVSTTRQKRDWVNFPKKLYREDPFWICPLDSEVEGVFDPAVNPCFKHGEAIRWLLMDEGKVIGRVAAFIDRVRSKVYRQPTGGLGYFEVINDKKAAFMLLDAAKDWLAGKGMEAIDGPINFGENDTNWGLLVEGFMQPTFGMPYNMKYYRDFFEEYGFRNYFDQYSYVKNVADVEVFPPRFMKIAEWVSKRPGYSFEHFRFADAGKYVNDVVTVYNSTWSEFKDDFTPLDPSTLYDTLRKAKPFIDEELIWFAYHNEKPVSFFILFPDLNQILKHLNGKMNLINMIRFLMLKRSHTMTRMRALVAGVHPKYQNSGIESAIFLHLYRVFRKKRFYHELELSWVGDFNPKMMAIYEAIGAEKSKVHTTYRYMLNPEAPFARYKDELAEEEQVKAEKE